MTSTLQGRLGFIKRRSRPIVGWELSGSPTVATFTCGKPPEATISATIEGSLIAPVTPVAKMKPAMSLSYKVVAGRQSPERFEGGPNATLTSSFLVGTEKTSEQSGLRMAQSLHAEESLEIKVACAGAGC